MTASEDMRKLMDELAAEMGEESSKYTPSGKMKLTEGELNEASVYEEAKFIAIMTWFMAESGMPGKHSAADILKEKYPEATPWTWISGYKVYLRTAEGK